MPTVAPSPAVRPPAPVTTPGADARRAAYCAPAGPEVFGGIVHGAQVWTADPFDVETIHADAREAFARLLNRASADAPPPHGATLLLLGEAGSGKTHLMRAFRAAAHAHGDGYCGYLRLTTRTDSYPRYVLGNLIDSLEQPYRPGSADTGLGRLARGLLDALDTIPADDRRKLTDDPTLDPDDVARLVHRFALMAVQYPRFRGLDVNVLRAVLFTLANDPRVHSAALLWLRCEDLSKYDRELIGDLVPRPQPEMAAKTVADLGRLIHAVHGAALVLLVDQIEEMIDIDWAAEARGKEFRDAINAVVEMAEGLPNAVVVLGCLDQMFDKGREFLPHAKLDRLMNDPPPVKLAGIRTAEEIAAIVDRRLEYLFDAVGADAEPAEPTAPFTAADLGKLAGMRARDALYLLLNHRNQCIAAGQWVPFAPDATRVPGGKDAGGKQSVAWEQKWDDFHRSHKAVLPGDDAALADLLAFAARSVSDELPANGGTIGAEADGRFVAVDVTGVGNTADKLYLAVCDKSTRGGGLSNQLTEVARKVGEIPAVLIRSTEFPKSGEAFAAVNRLTKPKGNGRKLVVADADWRALVAFREFHGRHHRDPGFVDWQRADRPLSRLPAVHTALDLKKLLEAPPAATVPPSPPPPPVGVAKPAAVPPAPPTPPPVAGRTVRVGTTRGALPLPVELPPAEFRRHAAFLGGSGSGKTTAALTVIEQLLLAGIPAVLLDRKGDLARYADPTAWDEPEADPDRAARKAALRAAIDVTLYTPGADAGRPLAIPVVPPDLAGVPAADREQTAQFAAANLGLMMGYKGNAPDPKAVILQKAIEVLAQSPGRAVTVRGLQQLVYDQDEALLAATDGFEDKHFRKLSQDLLTLALQNRRLLDAPEALDVDALLGRGPTAVPGKTRLSILNTQFLGSDGTADFWVSQFLLAVDRWRAKSPAADGVLQAVFLFDEADRYLPAVGKPATKGPMEGLLKRARSAGVGLFLATQSPGDFDYKSRDQVRTWLVGQVKEPVALGKLKPLLAAGRIDPAARLPGQSAGEFYLAREGEIGPVRADRNLIPTEQLPEDRILALARAGAPRSAVAG